MFVKKHTEVRLNNFVKAVIVMSQECYKASKQNKIIMSASK